jgi:hypothetical protein
MTVASGQLSVVRKKRSKDYEFKLSFLVTDNYLADNFCSRRCAAADESCSDRLANCFPFPLARRAPRHSDRDCMSLVRLSVRVR